jgi:hypothetical protein
MDRCDAEQEGITLPPIQATRLIAREECISLIAAHTASCTLVRSQIEERLRKTETSLAKLIGFMMGSGLLGGLSGALLAKLLH